MKSLFAISLVLLAATGCRAASPVLEPGTQTFATIDRPMGVAIARDGRVLVSDTLAQQIVVLDPDGSELARWPTAARTAAGTAAYNFERPMKLAAGATTLYVTDFLADRVVRLNLRSGLVEGWWGQNGSGDGDFDSPAGIAVDGEGRVWVTEFYNHRIQVFSPKGRFLFRIGQQGRGKDGFSYPTGIALTDNSVLVADAYNHRIKALQTDGTFLWSRGSFFSRPWPWLWPHLRFNVAAGVATGKGMIFVADEFHDAVQVMNANGEWLQTIRGIAHPSDLAVAADGTLYVAAFGSDQILQIPPASGAPQRRKP